MSVNQPTQPEETPSNRTVLFGAGYGGPSGHGSRKRFGFSPNDYCLHVMIEKTSVVGQTGTSPTTEIFKKNNPRNLLDCEDREGGWYVI
ncbi:hypothetical protein [Neolewinella persica]|uniref:hypothetical protein n=1 Tax=Neolewinella persica TaxID=70998 RepID=UPI00036ACFD3|nr:hypothetical protein [Neolewinella persica]